MKGSGNMSVLQEQVIQQVGNLSDDYLQFLLDMINRFMLPDKIATTDKKTDQNNSVALAAGGLHKYANASLIEKEKDGWRNNI